MHAYKSYIFVVSRSEGRATQRLPVPTQRLPSRDVLAQAFPAFKVFTHAQLITRLYVAGKAWVPRLVYMYCNMYIASWIGIVKEILLPVTVAII